MIAKFLRWTQEWFYFLTTFFPVKLFLLHLRRSHLLILFWLALFAFTGGVIGSDYGVKYLFIAPEYLEKTNFLSFAFVGASVGLFVMAFHISSYIYYSYRFPFLATLSRPLWKFSLNNSIIPILYVAYYTYVAVEFNQNEGIDTLQVWWRIGGFYLGLFLMISFTFTYFFGTIKTLEIPDDDKPRKNPIGRIKNIIKARGQSRAMQGYESVVNYYLKNPFKIKLARHASHYSREKLYETIQQHNVSAAIYFMLLILLVIGFSFASGNRLFMIPAGASVFLIFSLYLMVTGAFYTRLRTWTVSVGIVAIIILNYMSGLPKFVSQNYAYGMDYTIEPVAYNYPALDSLNTDAQILEDQNHHLKILSNWRAKFPKNKKPKLVIMNVSGGGQRSTVWTQSILRKVDSISEGRLFNQTHLIVGSSGGMVGAAYHREIMLRKSVDTLAENAYGKHYVNNISRDLLNPVAFTLAVNDLFFRFDKVNYGGHKYPKDRGLAFDRRLNEITEGFLDYPFSTYAEAEFKSQLPMFIMAPTIIGDGRKLLMSPQGLSFMTFSETHQDFLHTREYDGVEFARFFKNHDADSLRMITALRMSASFPFITPLVNLPSEPAMELIDAGVRDNEGLEFTLRYLHQFKDWIKANTSGVMVVQVKANRPDEVPIEEMSRTKSSQLTKPIVGVVQSFSNLQIYNKALLLELSRDYMDFDVDVVRFSLFEREDDVSLSWHLTRQERSYIERTVNAPRNQVALQRVLDNLEP